MALGFQGWTIILTETDEGWETVIFPPYGSGLEGGRFVGPTIGAALDAARDYINGEPEPGSNPAP